MKRKLRPIFQDVLVAIVIIQFMFMFADFNLAGVPIVVANVVLLIINVLILKKYGKDLYD